MERILDRIEKPNDIHGIDPSDYRQLAKEIRRLLVRTVSHTGGHLSACLGTVELTIALHACLHFPQDKLIWDVGHQSYTHKILTGRKEELVTLRQMGGLSGFPDPKESEADAFSTGHSSTSISAALGMAKARDLRGGDERIFAVIGDGALSGGMAYEAMNNAVELETGMVIVLNDNEMSIAHNVGGMSNYLGQIRADRRYRDLKYKVENALDKIPTVGVPLANQIRKTKDSVKHMLLPGMFFEDMGLTYLGPVNGHDIEAMKAAFTIASSMNDETVLVHVITRKGRGYRPAEEEPDRFHGIGAFDVSTGASITDESDTDPTYTEVFGAWLLDRGSDDESLVSVCAAMPGGTGVTPFSEKYPDRAYDVGIAEEHAVTYAAGLAAGGMRPVVSIYSTFLQRAYDQILNDVCIGEYPVIFAVDRSGIVGRDGRTHQGIFDLSYLLPMPGMTVIAPMDEDELIRAFDFAHEKMHTPVAIRYPRGKAFRYDPEDYADDITRPDFESGRAEVLTHGHEVVIFAVGDCVKRALMVRQLLKNDLIRVTVVNMRFVKPFDEELVAKLAGEHPVVLTWEDNVRDGGFGEMVGAFLFRKNVRPRAFLQIALPDEFVPHGDPGELYETYGMDPESVAKRVREALSAK